jgi:hypothetical protein
MCVGVCLRVCVSESCVFACGYAGVVARLCMRVLEYCQCDLRAEGVAGGDCVGLTACGLQVLLQEQLHA